jgi:hypothetical protein
MDDLTLSDQLVETTDEFTNQLAAYDELPADELGHRIARVAFDHMHEREVRKHGENPREGFERPLDMDYVDAFTDAFTAALQRAIVTRPR